MFSQVFVRPEGGSLSKGGLGPGEGVSVQGGRGPGEGSLSRWIQSRGEGLCPGEGVSVQVASAQGVCVQWGLCPGGVSVPGGFFVRGALCQGDPPYGKEWVVPGMHSFWTFQSMQTFTK